MRSEDEIRADLAERGVIQPNVTPHGIYNAQRCAERLAGDVPALLAERDALRAEVEQLRADQAETLREAAADYLGYRGQLRVDMWLRHRADAIERGDDPTHFIPGTVSTPVERGAARCILCGELWPCPGVLRAPAAVPTEQTTRTAAETLREVAERDPEAHRQTLARGYGVIPTEPTGETK